MAELEPPKGPSWAPRGREVRAAWPGLAECAGPLDLQSRLLTDRSLNLKASCHGRPRGGRIDNACGASPATPIHLGAVCNQERTLGGRHMLMNV